MDKHLIRTVEDELFDLMYPSDQVWKEWHTLKKEAALQLTAALSQPASRWLPTTNKISQESQKKKGDTVLHLALKLRLDIRVIENLIRVLKPKVFRMVDMCGRTPLHLAIGYTTRSDLNVARMIGNAYPEAVTFLDEYGMSPISFLFDKWEFMVYRERNWDLIEAIDFLVSLHPDAITVRDRDGRNLLHFALEILLWDGNNRGDAVLHLLRLRPELAVEAQQFSCELRGIYPGMTPLHVLLAVYDEWDGVETFLSACPPEYLSKKDELGRPLLHFLFDRRIARRGHFFIAHTIRRVVQAHPRRDTRAR